jgi:hypothetical protein
MKFLTDGRISKSTPLVEILIYNIIIKHKFTELDLSPRRNADRSKFKAAKSIGHGNVTRHHVVVGRRMVSSFHKKCSHGHRPVVYDGGSIHRCQHA